MWDKNEKKAYESEEDEAMRIQADILYTNLRTRFAGNSNFGRKEGKKEEVQILKGRKEER